MTEYERTGNRRKRSYAGAIAVMVTLMIVIIGSVALLFLPVGKKETRRPTQASATSPTPIASIATEEDSLLAIVLAVDTEIKTMTLYDVKRDEKVTVVYTGSSTFTDSFGKPMSAAQLPAGALLKFTINAEDTRVVKATEPRMQTGEDDVWEKKDVDKLEIVPKEHRITFGGQNYQYTDGLCVMSKGVPVELDTLLPIDRVSVRGSGSQIYEIIVTKGHGYLSLRNHEDFVDGTITIGSNGEQTITEEAKYLVKEGTYKVTVTHGAYTGTETITVARDEIAVFDVFEYGSGPIKKGTVTFMIVPLGATLYIDGERRAYYGEELTLDYGVHTIEVAAGGYITYEASIHVNSERQQLSIYLTEYVPEEEEDPEDPTTAPGTEDESQEESGTGGSTTDTSQTTGGSAAGSHTTVSIANRGYEINTNNAIYILGPSGATVYLDGELLGVTPIDFEKIIGSYLLTIVTEDGGVKNYNCTETNNGDDTYYNFD